MKLTTNNLITGDADYACHLKLVAERYNVSTTIEEINERGSLLLTFSYRDMDFESARGLRKQIIQTTKSEIHD